jgi:hypothetical protein
MGISTDGQLCFGVLFEDGYTFPWDEEPWNGDSDKWWLKGVHEFKPSFEIYDGEGGYLNGERPSQELIDKYYKEEKDFLEKVGEFPVKMENYCSGEYPMYIITLDSKSYTNNRGTPKEINPETDFVVTDEEKKIIRDFVDTYIKPEEPMEAKWYLSSYWG